MSCNGDFNIGPLVPDNLNDNYLSPLTEDDRPPSPVDDVTRTRCIAVGLIPPVAHVVAPQATTTAAAPTLPVSHFLPQHNDATKLIDIDFSKFGSFAACLNSCGFIHDNYVARVRTVFTKYLRAWSLDKTNELLWKKVLLLPIILFSSTERKELGLRIELLLQDHWSSFTLGSLQKKNVIHHSHTAVFPTAAQQAVQDGYDPWTPTNLRVKKLIECAELSKAMECLCSVKVPSTLTHDQQLQVLRDKHPEANVYRGDSDEDLSAVDIGNDLIITASMEEVRGAVQRSKKMLAHGLDMLRYEHLKQLVGAKPEPAPVEAEFCNLLTELINCLLAGKVPRNVLPAFRDNHLLGIPKKGNDVRPIGVGSVYRKLASSIGFQRSQEFNPAHFHTVQLALTRGGMEQIVHAFQLHIETHPDHDVFAIDADNAFNSANRYVGLQEVLHNYPALFPLMRDMYLDSSKGFVFGHPAGIKSVDSKEGLHQGDVLGTWGYIMTAQPLIEDLLAMLVRDFGEHAVTLVKFYVDDGNIAAPHDIMVRIIEFLQSEGPKYGFKIKPDKGRYLLGRCGSWQVAEQRKHSLLALGLQTKVICIHPDDDASVRPEEYGAVILGSFVGTDEFIRKQLEEYGKELERVADCLLSYPDLQGRWLLFLRCFTAKPIYLFRTVPPRLTVDLQSKVEELKKKILYSLLSFREGEMLDDLTYSSSNVGLQQGGLGLHDSSEIVPAAYASSMIAFSQSPTGKELQVTNMVLLASEGGDEIPCCPHIRSFLDSIAHIETAIGEVGGLGTMEQILQLRNSKTEGTVQHYFTDLQVQKRLDALVEQMPLQRLAWFTSLQNPEAGKWLEAIPKFRKLQMSNLEFMTALRFRLQLPAPGMLDGVKCSCKKGPTLDRCGHHLVSGCGNESYRKNLHDALVVELHGILSYCGCWAAREEYGCFAELDPNNKRRPDISIYNPVNSTKRKECVDVSVTCPIEGADSGVMRDPPSRAVARTPYRHAKIAFNAKKNKYGPLTDPIGFGFLPFIFESSGALDQRAKDFLAKYAKKAAEVRKIGADVLYGYFVKRLSLCLQKGIASSINGRLHKLNSHTGSLDVDLTWRHENVAEDGQYRA